RRLESRLTHGTAREERGEIIATDNVDEELLAACDAAMTEARAMAQSIDGRVRAVVRATREAVETVETTFSVTMAGLSIVSTPEHLRGDAERLRELATGNWQ